MYESIGTYYKNVENIYFNQYAKLKFERTTNVVTILLSDHRYSFSIVQGISECSTKRINTLPLYNNVLGP